MNFWKNKLMLPIAIIIMLVVLYIDKTWIFGPKLNKNKFTKEMTKIAEANQEQVFKVSKIIKYSSAEAIDNSEAQNLKDVSISQYSDIAIYIDNMSDELTEKNTIKELYLDNFKIDVDYNHGTPELYYKNPLEISKFRLIDQNKIEDKLIYDIIYTNKDNQNANYEKPTFFTDCSNPITFGLINKDIIRNYEVTKDNGLVSFDGRIFNNLDVDLQELSPKISFKVHLKNNLDESFVCNMSVDLKLETSQGSVKSGYIIEISDEIGYYRFFKE